MSERAYKDLPETCPVCTARQISQDDVIGLLVIHFFCGFGVTKAGSNGAIWRVVRECPEAHGLLLEARTALAVAEAARDGAHSYASDYLVRAEMAEKMLGEARVALVEAEQVIGIIRVNSRHIPASLDGVMHNGAYAIRAALAALPPVTS